MSTQKALAGSGHALSWCAVLCLSYSPIAGHNALYGNDMSAYEPRAFSVRRKYLQGLGTWRRGHVVQGYRALAKGASRKPDPGPKSTIDLFVEDS